MFELLTDISFWSFPFYFLIILFAYGIIVDNFVTPRRKLTDFKNKHVFITGGSSGLGKSIAVNFAREGAHVTIVARDVKKLEDAKKEIESARVNKSQKVLALSTDVTNYKDLENCIKKSVAEVGQLDIAVANAGFSYPCYFNEAPIETLEREVKINYMGYLYLVKLCLPYMVEKRSGHFILVSSAIVVNPIGGYGNYSATKMAVKGLADSLRNELNMYNVGVTLFCPANIDTDGFKEENKTKPDETKEIEGKISTVTPDECAKGLFAALRKGSYYITVDFFPDTVLKTMTQPLFSPRDNVVVDGILSFVFNLISPFLQNQFDSLFINSKKSKQTSKKNN